MNTPDRTTHTPSPLSSPLPLRRYADVRAALLEKREIALLDAREEDPFSKSHPLFAANLPLSRIELDVRSRIPRLDTAIVVYDNGEGLAEIAANRLRRIGYTDVALLEGGLAGWRDAGGELFQDVNVPSKSFGELVESKRHTPSLSAPEVQALLDAKADVVVLDARRFEEYQTMNIPGSTSVPGAELALRVRALAPSPKTQVIVNCAGRTRSIIGTQSLVNFGIPNPVAALRNGTIGWTLAGQQLAHGSSRRFGPVDEAQRADASQRARAVADQAGVARASLDALPAWRAEPGRTTYVLDVRTPEEFEAGHLPASRSAPGGQLVQETDHVAPVRGARIVLLDDDGVRANMTGSWLAQMGWDVHVIDGPGNAVHFSERGAWRGEVVPAAGEVKSVQATVLAGWLKDTPDDVTVLDLAPHAEHVKRHIPGAWFALRSELERVLRDLPATKTYVLTSRDSAVARYAASDLVAPETELFVLEGGTDAWAAAGLPVQAGSERLASPAIDRYRRPYEGTDNAQAAMQAYLDWEFGLVDQLARDGTHGFRVI